MHTELTTGTHSQVRSSPPSHRLAGATRRSRRIARQGTAAVEFALILPILLMLVFGIIEFGRAFMVAQVLTTAAREGARAAVLAGATGSAVSEKVNTVLMAAAISSQTVTTTVSPADLSTARTGTTVTVQVSVPYASITWLPAPSWIMGNSTLRCACVMRHE